MLSYEICKELKDAGFPLKINSRHIANQVVNGEYTGLFAYRPTLEELIEACGDNFWSLTASTAGDAWYARSVSMFSNQDSFHGDTPAEAVANLWLALNKKETQ